MGSIEDTVERFGKSMDIEGLRFNRHNVVRLDIERYGRLYLERLEHEIALYLAVQVQRSIGDAMACALVLCHFRQVRPISVSALFQPPDWLIFSVRLNRQEFTPDSIEIALDHLYPCVDHIRIQ